MATQFELRLVDGNAAEGELEADDLLAIVQSLKELAMKLGRAETDAEPVGRPSRRTTRVAKLSIGLAAGSTRVLVRRSEIDEAALPIELDEERIFDEKFQAIVESIAVDERPDWVSDTVAVAASSLRAALEAAAPVVEFKANGGVRRTFRTKETHRETWRTAEAPRGEAVTFVGRLRAVNLDTHRLQVTDDVGNKVALPNVLNGASVGRLLDEYVEVIGTPERDARGRLTQLYDAVIQPAAAFAQGIALGVREPLSLDDILASAPGLEIGGIPGLTEEEAVSFLRAIGL